MNMLEMILGSQNNGTLNQVAKSFGLGQSETKSVVEQLLPMVTRGLQRNTSQQGGMDALIDALSSGNHQKYIDQPDLLNDPSTINDGNSILGHIFGSKDVSRNVAAHAASRTGISSSIIKKMLPVIATMAMGALSKKASSGGLLGSTSRNLSSNDHGLISSFLDSDYDGSIADDLLSMAVKFI